jgi:hypothetical protein
MSRMDVIGQNGNEGLHYYITARGGPLSSGSNIADVDVFAQERLKAENNATNPKHYRSHPSGIECIQITEHMPFCEGNAIKYIWRAGLKDDKLQDLEKAAWYIARAIEQEVKKRRK